MIRIPDDRVSHNALHRNSRDYSANQTMLTISENLVKNYTVGILFSLILFLIDSVKSMEK